MPWTEGIKPPNNASALSTIFANRKPPPVVPLPSRVPRQNSQSGKIFNISKTNNLNQLNGPTSDCFTFKHTEFFNDHMTAFELWLKTADDKKPVPIQLPILLQVLFNFVAN